VAAAPCVERRSPAQTTAASRTPSTNPTRGRHATGATIGYAGANGENENDGALIQTRLTYNDGTDDTDLHFVPAAGAITILGFSGSTLSWTSERGAIGTYDVNTQQVAVKNCGGPSQIPCPA
jgi:hypothetical protein